MARKICKNEKNIASRQMRSQGGNLVKYLINGRTGKLTFKMLVVVCGVEGDDSH
jgi:hypothetical protein